MQLSRYLALTKFELHFTAMHCDKLSVETQDDKQVER